MRLLCFAFFLLVSAFSIKGQSHWVVLSEGGNYLFECDDSLVMISNLRAREIDNYILMPDSPVYIKNWGNQRYNVLRNPQKGVQYKNLKGLADSLLWQRIVRHTPDSIAFQTPYTDTLPDGLWYVYRMNNRQNMEIFMAKEVHNYKITGNYYIYFDWGTLRSTYMNGFPVGHETCVNHHTGHLMYETLYKDSLRFVVYEKTYDSGKLFNFRDMKANIYYEYFPDGKTVQRKCPLDKYGELHGTMEIYSMNGELIDIKSYSHGMSPE